jgi:hypothetical protein
MWSSLTWSSVLNNKNKQNKYVNKQTLERSHNPVIFLDQRADRGDLAYNMKEYLKRFRAVTTLRYNSLDISLKLASVSS